MQQMLVFVMTKERRKMLNKEKKWRSIAVRPDNKQILDALCRKTHRSPGPFVEKLLTDYLEFKAKQEKISVDKYVENLMETYGDRT